MWICTVEFKEKTRYLANGRLTGSKDKALRFDSKKRAQKAFQAFFRGARMEEAHTVTFHREEAPVESVAAP